MGRPLRLRFELTALGKVGCRAIVRRRLEDRGVGVEFMVIDPTDRTGITTFVEQHQTRLR